MEDNVGQTRGWGNEMPDPRGRLSADCWVSDS